MLNKLRWRFIFSAMIAIFAVLLILLLTINITNFIVTTNELDNTLQSLSNQSNDLSVPAPRYSPLPRRDIAPSPHEQHSMLFFTVRCNSSGVILSIERNPFLSLSDDEIAETVNNIISEDSSSGYYSGYRYMINENTFGLKISLLGCTIELQNMRNLLYVSCIVTLICVLAVFGLIVAFSRKVIDPYVKNMELQKQFITDAGHELKTPLTSIATSADVLAMEHADDEWIQNIQKQTVRMGKLVTNLVTLSRLDEANPFPEASDFSLSDAVWEIAEPFAALAEAKGKCYQQRIQDELHMHGDKAAIQQMISILLDNAIKYSNVGGNICLEVFRKHKSNVIRITNTCDHIDTVELDKLFERFYRPDRSRSKHTGGTGIGLSIAKATAEAHNGKITVSSCDQESICFTVIF